MSRSKLLLVTVSCLLLMGCGGPSPVPVSGSVKYNGNPVPNVSVIFLGTEGSTATGQTDADGNFSRVNSKHGEGALPGDYTVTITPSTTMSDEPISDPSAYDAAPAEPPFPGKYSDTAASDLKVTVSAGGENKFDLTLTD